MMKLTRLQIIEKTNWLNSSDPIPLRNFCLENNITSQEELPKCPVCSMRLRWRGKGNKKFLSFCSPECKASSKGVAIRMGKCKDTVIDKYGVDHISKVESITSKRKATMLDRYGVEYSLQSDDLKKKFITTMRDKYGVSYAHSSPELRQRFEDTMVERYRDKQYSCSEAGKSKAKLAFYPTLCTMLGHKQISPLFTAGEFVTGTSLTYKCLKCDKDFSSEGTNAQTIHCTECPSFTRSSYEYEIDEWLKGLGVSNIEANSRFYKGEGRGKFLELDIYLPDQGIGIEFNGVYWHSDLYKAPDYHQKKYLYFKDRGIRLIQILESEWVSKKEVVKSILMGSLGLLPTTIYARKCVIKVLSPKEYSLFLTENHLQGTASAKIRLGLFSNDALVAVQSYSHKRFSKYNENNTYEMIRFCSKTRTTVVGGFSKLFQYFIKNFNPVQVDSFIDVRYFGGDGYYKNGFKLKKLTSPNYYYFHSSNSIMLFNRTLFQKHKLEAKLPSFDDAKSEYNNMVENGYVRIHDAGNLLMTYTN